MALRTLNDDRLTFPALYILRPEITKLGLEPFLSPRNSLALRLAKEFASGDCESSFVSSPEYRPVLKWMLLSGCTETGMGNEYDRVIDAAAALLIKEHGDTSCLGTLADALFMRHRAGLFTYDAEWAFFESGEPECLAMVASRLLSDNARDIILARRLLKSLPCFDESITDPARQYRLVTRWLDVNKPHLYYTGESCLLCGDPCRFRVSEESKYLQRSVNALTPLSPGERASLEKIRALDPDTRGLLCECSCQLRKMNERQWLRWIESPLYVQIETSRHIAGKRGPDGYY